MYSPPELFVVLKSPTNVNPVELGAPTSNEPCASLVFNFRNASLPAAHPLVVSNTNQFSLLLRLFIIKNLGWNPVVMVCVEEPLVPFHV